MLKYLGILFSLFAFLGCGGEVHPRIVSFTPASVIVDLQGGDLYKATDLAQRYCSSHGRNAQYVRTEKDTIYPGVVAFFNCVDGVAHGVAPAQPLIVNNH